MNGRFHISVHILTLLDAAKGELVSSDYLAGSINTNPALVRKELSNLRKHGLIISKEGKAGGYMLAKSPEQIRFADVYEAVKQTAILGQARNEPNPKCPVGRQINQHLKDMDKEIGDAVIKKLYDFNLADFSEKFY